MDKTKTNEEILQNFAEQEETNFEKTVPSEEPKVTKHTFEAEPLPIKDDSPVSDKPVGPRKVITVQKLGTKESLAAAYNTMGWIDIDVAQLPSKGYFYPVGTRIMIKSATGEEIKYWSTIDEENPIGLDDMLDYILEKCCTIRLETEGGVIGSWKDLKVIDRIYVILAIRELTFPSGEGTELKIDSGTEQVVVDKGMLRTFDMPVELTKFYNNDERCFVFPYEGYNVNVYLPSVGTDAWLKKYITDKLQRNETFDKSFFIYADLLIDDYRYLTNEAYEKMVSDSAVKFTVDQWSLLSYVKDVLTKKYTNELVYTNSEGEEKVSQLNFRGGIKSLFLVSDPLSRLSKN